MTSILLLLLIILAEPPAEETLVDFTDVNLPSCVVTHDATLTRVEHGDGFTHRADFDVAPWPQVYFQAPEGGWDWSQWAGVGVTMVNPGTETLTVNMRVDNPGADGMKHCNNANGSIRPGERYTLRCRFNTGAGDALWGMRGVPEIGPLGQGPLLDTTKITAFQVFLARPAEAHTLLFERAFVFGRGGDVQDLVAFPFVNEFGQYAHGDWPGKLQRVEELTERREAEAKALTEAPPMPDRDAFGGWLGGPQLPATGWFRTAKLEGYWWLVTPEGHLFFSNGIDCVGTWQQTFVEGREDWFAWLPAPDSPFASFYGHVENAHSMAEPIDGKGKTFSFYRANLFRKYGEDWPAAWRSVAYKRLAAWGFNTLGNWSEAGVLMDSPLPYVVAAGSPPVPAIEGAEGYWAKMKDVYTPSFEEDAVKYLAWIARHAENPKCIGFFSDNELAWEGVATGTLASPSEQPCRKVFVSQLREKYGDLAALNAAWGTAAETWDALRAPGAPNAAAQVDLDTYLYRFARRYFEVVNTAIKVNAPHHLYLGCRFSGAPDPVIQAGAEVADVVSFNIYRRAIPPADFRAFNAPVLIGEFHFGALDRGMFHTGLVPVEDQAERAKAYANYVRSAAVHPNVVGCHWFQYVDEPITGRWYDGENYNIGFVDVTDTPYPELVEAAREAHEEVYPHRSGK